MIGLPPGNILQYLYLKERLGVLKNEGKSSFIEVGSGNGNVSKILLEMGFEGAGYDLNGSACENNKSKNEYYIVNKKYNVNNNNFITADQKNKVDIIISCMVIEHMPYDILVDYFEKCRIVLKNNGVVVSLVPSSMKHWGVEDDIAGHIKRYEFIDFQNLANKFDFKEKDICGLTYPLSNIVFSLSNQLVAKNESDKLALSQEEKTIYTGNREVQFKTTFPKVFNVILNPVIMYPFHILQKLFRMNSNSMVIYSELQKK
jgi:SAM-dependent methyltransferase